VNRIRSFTLLVALAIFPLTGCISWVEVKEPDFKAPNNAYTLQAPVGWMRISNNNFTLITRDSPYIQAIEINKFTHKNAFSQTGVTINENTLVTELAEYYIANYKAVNSGASINHLETKPAKIDGNSAFRLHLEHINSRGLIFDVIIYGFTDKSNFYHLLYRAPRIHYFEKDLQTFETVVQSFQVAEKMKKASLKKQEDEY